MKTFNNELVIHRGETFSMDKVVQNKDGSPYIVSNKLKNPYVLVAVSTTRYDQNKRYLLNLWLPLTDNVRFSITEPIDLTSFKTETNGIVSKYTSFDDVNVRGPVPGSGGKNCIVSGYIGDQFVFYDYDDCVLYLENEQGIKEYRYWNLEQEGLLKYEFRITCPFTQDITSKWVEQSYVYSMTLMSGELPASGEPPFANIDTVQPLLIPTKLSVLSSINGGF